MLLVADKEDLKENHGGPIKLIITYMLIDYRM